MALTHCSSKGKARIRTGKTVGKQAGIKGRDDQPDSSDDGSQGPMDPSPLDFRFGRLGRQHVSRVKCEVHRSKRSIVSNSAPAPRGDPAGSPDPNREQHAIDDGRDAWIHVMACHRFQASKHALREAQFEILGQLHTPHGATLAAFRLAGELYQVFIAPIKSACHNVLVECATKAKAGSTECIRDSFPIKRGTTSAYGRHHPRSLVKFK